MTPKEVKAVVDAAYRALERAAEKHQETQKLFDLGFEANVRQEKGHRRMGSGLGTGRYRASVQTVARYFLVKWYLEPAKVESAKDATLITLSALYSTALRDWLPEVPNAPSLIDVLALDYAEHMSDRVRG